MGAAPPDRHAGYMQRTGRQGSFIERVRIAMIRCDERRMPGSSATRASRRLGYDSEQMTRWENEGGSLGHTVGQRPRPFP